MSLMITVDCDMCFPPRKPGFEFEIEDPKDLALEAIKERIEREGWIVQVIKNQMFVYCTKKCAE
jgi:hypothetical protein